ncbi:hypothetical protein [Halobellus rufus]|uniref:hypothetical protein n=1 Tax=Halobellus rufus TaxID=1448860 RepID=UPI0006789D76|nr:hypothetical protein [Halobellus rufus]
MTDALDAVVDAALERALVADRDARRYFALAGVLERVGRGRDGRDPDREGCADPDVIDDPLCASLVSTIAVRALARQRDQYREFTSSRTRSNDVRSEAQSVAHATISGLDTDAWDPSPDDEWTAGGDDRWIEFVATGAHAAIRRLDADRDTVTSRSGLTPAELDRYRYRRPSGE